MKNFLNILLKHKWAIILAVLIGLIMAAPHIYFIIDNQDAYQGIFMGGLDEGYYLTRIQELRDNHFNMGNPYWLEGKDLPCLRPYLSEIIISSLGQIFGLNSINSVLLGNFVFPFLIFILIYLLVYHLIEKKIIALVASSVVLLANNLINFQSFWQLLINQETSSVFLSYTRLVSPQIHTLFFFAFFLFFWLFLKKKKNIYGLLSAIVFGLSFYVYPYTWTFIFAFIGLMVIIFVFRKEWSEIKKIILIALIAFAISIPFFWKLFQAMNHPLYLELSFRTGVIESHAFKLGSIILILLGIFLLFFPRDQKRRYDFSLAFVLTPFIVINQQIITGYLLTSAKYHYHYHKPMFVIFLIIIVFNLLKKRKIYQIVLATLIFVFIFYNAFLIQIKSYQAHEKQGIEEQKYGTVFEYLNKQAQKDDVVMANFIISDLIPIYTSLNSISSMDAHYCLGADEEQLIERMFLQYRFNGLKPEKATEVFFQNRKNISAKIYGQGYRKLLGSYEKIPDEKLYYFVEKYINFLNIPLEDILLKYQAKYFIWDIIENPDWLIDKYSFLEQIYQVNDIKIYQINY